MADADNMPVSNFIRDMIDRDLASGKHQNVITRFPPEPNGYLHIGHAKSICLNFGIAQDYNGQCNLRFDDTNPTAEDVEYVESIIEDVRWLGFDWGKNLFFASDYFEQMYMYAEEMIRKGLAYVCTLTPDEFKDYRGVPTRPGKNSPWRDRPAAENLDLFRRMKAGEFADGEYVLRARIDMASPNLHLRDPAIYRIRRAHHHRTGDRWCLYPMYDFAHGLEDAIEGITHSICTLEFEVHRPLYDWLLDQLDVPCHPQQIEFARLNLTYTVMSKRKLLELVKNDVVSGWDDPRMPTIQGMRRRGYTPQGIREFAKRIGVSKSENSVDMAIMESAIREDLELRAPRVMAIIHPLKVSITNADGAQTREADFHPNVPELGKRVVPFSKELLIEADDFAEVPPPGWKRLTPGGEIRLRHSYVMRCDEAVKDAAGRVIELKCSIDHDTLGKNPEGRKVKGVIHFLSREHALPAEIRLYDRLFTIPEPDADKEKDFLEFMNPHSLEVVQGWVESAVKDAAPETHYQFERLGYFVTDRRDHQPGGKPVFNRTVTLRDSWHKEGK